MAENISGANFADEVLASDTPVIVDCWAEWCAPCHQGAPVLDAIAEERGDSIKVVKINIDEDPDIASQYGVVSIPTIVLFKDGEPSAAAVGAQPKKMLEESLGLDGVVLST